MFRLAPKRIIANFRTRLDVNFNPASYCFGSLMNNPIIKAIKDDPMIAIKTACSMMIASSAKIKQAPTPQIKAKGPTAFCLLLNK